MMRSEDSVQASADEAHSGDEAQFSDDSLEDDDSSHTFVAEHINFAKLRSSLAWILQKAYGENVASELKDPFYEKPNGGFQVKPNLINRLVSSDVYCLACASMFSETSQQWQGHSSIIQVLSRKGIYVMEKDESAVTETILMQTAPFRVNAHLALIDSLMLAYASEIVSVERAVQAVRRITTFTASSELPSITEDTVVFWMNKVCVAAMAREKKQSQLIDGNTNQKIAMGTQLEADVLPVINDLLKDVGDGCSLALVCSFYCPQLLRQDDICLKESLGIADSLYNMRLVKNLCEKHLPTNFFHFKYEDLLYEQAGFRENLLAFLAELFYWFEIQKLTESGEVLNGQDGEGHPITGSSRVTKHQVPISNATKCSFHKTDESRFTPDQNKSNSISQQHLPQNRQVLLPKRQNGKHGEGTAHQQTDTPQFARRAHPVSSPPERNVAKQSVLAWQDQEEHPQRRGSVPVSQDTEASALLANVSIDSELCDSFGRDELRLSDFDTPRTPQPTLSDIGTTQSQMSGQMANVRESDGMKLESVTPGDQSRRSNLNELSDKPEPLMLAVLKPAKEKHLNHTKAEERDETPRKKTTSPTKPRKSRSSPVNTSHPSQEFFSPGDITVEATVSLNVDSSQLTCSSSDEPVAVTPLPEDQLSPRLMGGKNDEVNVEVEDNEPRGYEAFYINPDVSVEVSLPSLSLQTDEVASSYTVTDHVHTIESARAAGIPVVLKSNETSPLRRATSRDGSMTSSRSSGDFSDHESHKIHYDHKARETSATKVSPRPVLQTQPEMTKPSLVITNPPPVIDAVNEKTKSLTTFAEIKRIKDTYGNINNSGMVYMQHGQDPRANGTAPLKSAFLRKQADTGKKTSFAMLPNETTWELTARQSQDAEKDSPPETEQPAWTELSSMRLKLDEKRKEIMRRKHRLEMQQTKARQRLGKAAFMRVMSRHMDPGSQVDPQSGIEDQDDVNQPRSLSASPTPASDKSRPFSREGIQETIDNIRRKWFRTDEFPGQASRPSDLFEDVGKDPAAVRSQSSVAAVDDVSHSSGSPSAQPMTDSAGSIPSSEDGASFEAYDSSLDKLNQSLTELQGEISRLSLQQEQILSMQSPQGTPPVDPRLHPVTKESQVDPRRHPGTKPTPLAGFPVPHQIALPPGVHLGQGEPYDPRKQGQQGQTPKIPVNRASPDVSKPMPENCQSLPYTAPLQSLGQTFVPAAKSANQPQTSLAETYNVNNTGSVSLATTSHNIGGYTFLSFDEQHSDAQSETQKSSVNQQQTSLAEMYVNNMTPAPAGQTVGHNAGGNMFQSLERKHSDSQMVVSSENDAVIDDGTSSHTSSGGNEGFFVSFGDEDSKPKRSKPRLNKDKTRKNNYVAQVNNSSVPTPPLETQSTTVHGSPLEVQGTPTISVYKSPRAAGDDSHNSSGVGYVLHDSESLDTTTEQEMSSKKDKLKERQIRRKEEQERRKMEKLNESIEQRERQRLKQEETERKKAEEKARRKQIYEQYLLKRRQKEAMENGEEYSGEPSRVTERAPKAKPRPKSMFVKAPPSDQEDSSSLSSQDDTSIRGFGRKSRPYASSPSSHFRIGSTRGNMRKAVSCNVLTQNGQPGGATYRRPPSPDLSQLGRRTPRNVDGVGEYIGPKLFVKPSSKSNRHIILNAVSHCCLAGIVNTDMKNKVLEELAKSEAKHFLVLFRDGGCQYRAIYSYVPETEEVIKICGVGPKQITNKMIHKFYKYNSGAKSFAEVTSTKHMSVSIDAVVLHNSLWKTGKPAPTTKKV